MKGPQVNLLIYLKTLHVNLQAVGGYFSQYDLCLSKEKH